MIDVLAIGFTKRFANTVARAAWAHRAARINRVSDFTFLTEHRAHSFNIELGRETDHFGPGLGFEIQRVNLVLGEKLVNQL